MQYKDAFTTKIITYFLKAVIVELKSTVYLIIKTRKLSNIIFH